VGKDKIIFCFWILKFTFFQNKLNVIDFAFYLYSVFGAYNTTDLVKYSFQPKDWKLLKSN